jgi:anaerobic magnesium-protoporphyrin IX monomethyl ester cyclase
MNIVLVNPGFHKIKSFIVIPNLGLLYLARSLELKGHTVIVIDALKDALSEDELVEKILFFKPDVVGFSMLTPAFLYIKYSSEILRKENKKVMQVAGGIHPTSEPESTLEEIDTLDFLFQGESEISFPQFLDLYFNNRENSQW